MLAFIDGRHVATHPFASGIWDTVIRPALFLGTVLCLAAVYAEGAFPQGPWGSIRRRSGLRLTVVIAVLLGVGLELLDLLGSLQAASETTSWSSSGEDATYSSLVYAASKDAIEAIVFLCSALLSLALIAVLVLAIFAPACVMRFGPRGLISQSWQAIRRHWLAIGIRALAFVPISLIALPILSYWQVEDWSVGLDTTPERISQIQFAIDMCNAVGVDGIAYSALASTALFGLFLWWIGRSTGVLLDRQE